MPTPRQVEANHEVARKTHEGIESPQSGWQKHRSLLYHLKTLFLFTKSDFKTVVLPHTTFAITGALSAANLMGRGPLSLLEVAARLPLVVFWIWSNLLVEDLANQRTKGGIIEDTRNKPWRPIPSGRITPYETQLLLLMAIPLTVGLSAALGALKPSLCLMSLVWMYNDLEGSSVNVWLRNLLNAGGLMSFSWGALSVMSKDHTKLLRLAMDGDAVLPERAYWWILATGVIIVATVHAQDMPDIEGDKARGRKTMPLLYGESWARGSVAVMVTLVSVLSPFFFSGPTSWWAAPPLLLGCSLSILTLLRRGQAMDEVAWKLWCFWTISLYLLPLSAPSRGAEMSG